MKSSRPSLSSRMGTALLALAVGIALILSGCSNPASSDETFMPWTWVAGSGSINQAGDYPDAVGETGTPSGRYGAATWYDSDGNLWLFGGNGYSSSSSYYYQYRNDLWKYDTSAGTWTWIAGSSSTNQAGTYPSAFGKTGTPGARYFAVSWYDSDNNCLWLFGGYGYCYSSSSYGRLNDLWKYDIDAGTWTWVAGSKVNDQSGTYTGDTLYPGARYETVAWYDSTNKNLWLFGGYGYGSSSMGYLNDLWKYDGTDWTWVAGSSSVGQTGTYPDAVGGTGTPGARGNSAAWVDSDGNFWLFGGYGYGSSSSDGYLNDLWKYDGTDWTWVSGSNIVYKVGTYPSTIGRTGIPGARSSASAWTDSDGTFWLFGGQGYGSSSSSTGYLNDLWTFTTDSGTWVWEAGSSSVGQAGIYPSATGNLGLPGGRYGAAAWTDSDGNFWLFGGGGYGASSSYGKLNDLWKYSD